MYYIMIKDNKPYGYPVTENILREILRSVSLPATINAEELVPLGFAQFSLSVPPIVQRFQVYEEDVPAFDGTQVTQIFKIRDMSDQEKEIAIADKLEESRNLQKSLLADSDWTELPSVQLKHDQAWVAAWVEYRTSLRDVDKQQDWPFEVEWPRKPDV
jgi:hypothetical protein